MSATLRIAAGAALGPLRRRPDAVPERVLERAGVAVDRAHLAAYDRVCGFPLADPLPATYPHVLAFPLALELMAAGDFPFGVLGLVHVRNAIEQLRPLDAGEPLDLRVWAERLAAHPRGRTVDVVAEAAAGGAVAWRGRSTYLRRERRRRRAPRRRTTPRRRPPPCGACRRDIGRRYAAVSGDRNPIHLHPLPARAARPAGRDRPRDVDAGALPGRARRAGCPTAFTVEVAFKRRVRLPADVAFATWRRRARAPLRAARRAQRQAAPDGRGQRFGVTGRCDLIFCSAAESAISVSQPPLARLRALGADHPPRRDRAVGRRLGLEPGPRLGVRLEARLLLGLELRLVALLVGVDAGPLRPAARERRLARRAACGPRRAAARPWRC